ncbi:MAG TPA: hypothetical protein PLE81_09680 [Brevundimonas sp.]|jgi:hypothetical protein|uniref:hypothetical protein n=1 Tax=Brevundimonas sp. TaxID=1871086 RepID=UPI002BB4B463|nr:hypothetical protein [Brevundimonas sp.]HRH20890.1 hypothetical protein [Brevundimonas sp.]
MRLTVVLSLGLGLALASCAATPATGGPSYFSGQRTAGLDEAVRLSNLRIIPLEVVEDSRCPTDVDCVWAGRLVVRVMIQSSAFPTRTESMELGRGIALEDARSLTITAAEPDRVSGVAVRPSDYRLTFTLGPGD